MVFIMYFKTIIILVILIGGGLATLLWKTAAWPNDPDIEKKQTPSRRKRKIPLSSRVSEKLREIWKKYWVYIAIDIVIIGLIIFILLKH